MDERRGIGDTSELRFSVRDLQSSTFSDTSSESSEDTVAHKLGSFKILITHLQKELHAEKVKTRGQNSIINSFNEVKRENVDLKATLKQKSDAVTVLQNRLDRLGGDTSVRLGEGEFLLPGPSKQVLDSLAEENIQLKKSLKYVAVDPARMEHLQRQLRAVEFDLKENQWRCKHLESENKRLSSLLNSSDIGKDLEILRLEQRVSELENNKDTQNILCQSLSDETEDLRAKLRETVSQCQQLEQRLGTSAQRLYGSTSGNTTQQQNVMPMEDVKQRVSETGGVPSLTRSVSEQLEQSIGGLQTLVKRQEKEIMQVNEMNMKWQRYNDQREEFVRKLQKKLSDVEDRLAQSQTAGGGISEQQQAEIDRIILQYKRKVEVVEEEKQQIEDENRLVKTQLVALQDEMKTKDEEITLLRGHVQILSNRDSVSGDGYLADKERIELLEQQITVWREDFKQERQDREKSVANASKLEAELHFVRRQLEQFQGQHMEDLAVRRQQSLSNQERQYNYRHPYPAQDMMGRGTNQIRYETDSEDTVDATVDFGHNLYLDNAGVPQQQKLIAKSAKHFLDIAHTEDKAPNTEDNVGTNVDNEDILECPKCHLGFPPSEHFQLLDHINECC